jgi:2,3-bisphosphoglycerate-independent phosphoglycerate mutase
MIGKIVQANHNNITIITSDHGNAEEIIPYKSISNRATFHTTNPVPFIFIKKNLRKDLIKNAIVSNHVPMYDVLESPYNLADIAPTILDVFNINKPQGMTGQSLLKTIGYK